MKYGKKNEIKVNPLMYNLGLIGEAGIGKTTIIKEYCEKLAGEDGYIFLEIGKEDGGDAINGINYLNCPEWDADYDEETNSIGFNTFVEDVVDNRVKDWANLKVVVIDTYDELFAIAEPEVIAMHNRENPNKQVRTINASFGGFQAGQDKAVEIVLNALWSLKKVNVSFIVIGHTKSRNVTDSVTGEDYLQLTSNMPQKYFNAIKTKVHFLGVAAIDRKIVQELTGKKNVVTGEKIKKGVIKEETRKITFRDDSYVIDSKSRFADIVESIPMDSDELIKAITNAIEKELEKSGKKMTDAKKEQDKKEKERMKHIEADEKNKASKAELNEVISEIIQFFTANKTDLSTIKPIMEKVKELGYANPKEIDNIEDAKVILEMTKAE